MEINGAKSGRHLIGFQYIVSNLCPFSLFTLCEKKKQCKNYLKTFHNCQQFGWLSKELFYVSVSDVASNDINNFHSFRSYIVRVFRWLKC